MGLAACSLPFGDDGDGDGDRTATSTTSSGPDLARAGREMTEAEIESAISTGPDSWKPQGASSARVAWRRTDPPQCVDVLRIGAPAKELVKHEQASAQRAWGSPSGSPGSATLLVDVRSHDRPVGPDLLDAAGAALSECDAFALTGQALDTRVLADSLAFPGLGEQTFAVRLTTWELVNRRSMAFYVSYVTVRVGHNLVVVSVTTSDADLDLSVLESQTREVLRRLAT